MTLFNAQYRTNIQIEFQIKPLAFKKTRDKLYTVFFYCKHSLNNSYMTKKQFFSVHNRNNLTVDLLCDCMRFFFNFDVQILFQHNYFIQGFSEKLQYHKQSSVKLPTFSLFNFFFQLVKEILLKLLISFIFRFLRM